MSKQANRGPRVHALAAATAVVLATSFASAFAAERIDLASLSDADGHDRFIVRYKAGTEERANPRAAEASLNGAGRAVAASASGKALKVGHLRRMSMGADVIRTDRKLSRIEAEQLMREIAADPDVEYIEADRLLKPVLTPNDPSYSQQWGYFDSDAGIRANQAWDVSTGSGVIVAVIDTGITNHSDLNANVVAGYDFIGDTSVSNDGNGRDSDPSDPGDWTTGQCGPASNSSWHGTHVAGTVAAVTNNSKGVAGTAFGAKVMPVRVLGTCGGYTSDIADAIVWSSGGTVSGVPSLSAANVADVINMSLGGSGSCGSTTQNAINGAVGRGTTVVVAAGNSSADASNFTPASCNNVITVASITSASSRSSFSNYGAKIDVSAPGSSILSTLNSGSTTPGSESYASYNGTSMASPHVAGTVALVQSRRVAAGQAPYTPAEVETLLKNTAYPLSGSCSGGCGAGIVDAKAAVDAAGGGGGGGGNELADGVPVSNISGAQGSTQFWTMAVPAGASNLAFTIAGGSGDADLYVKFGSQPTTSSYDCRPYLNGNNETCTFASPQAGTYHVMLRGYTSFSGVSLTGSYDTGGGGGTQTYSNTANYTINDNSTVESPISVSGRSGNAGSSVPVAVNIVHTYIGDLKVDLVAPDGSVYVLHNRSGGSANNINTTYNVNLSSEALNGTWKLRVNDNYSQDTGYIDSWSVTF